jgi:hypothetical protein
VEAIRELVQVDRLVLERAPQPLDENIVQAAPAAVHGDRHTGVPERVGEGLAGELAALIRIEDLRAAVSIQRLLERLDAEPGIERVRQPPGQHVARRPIHDRDQIQKAAPDRNVGDVGTPDVVRSLDR